MKYEKTLKLSSKAFRAVAVISLLTGLICLACVPLCLVIGSYFGSIPELPALPAGGLSHRSLHAMFTSATFLGAIAVNAVGALLGYFLFGTLARLMENLREQNWTASAISLRRSVKLLLATFTLSLIHFTVDAAYRIKFAAELNTTTQTAAAKAQSPLTDALIRLSDLLLPGFDGSSALVLALLLFLLSRFLDEKTHLQNRVETLTQEVELTI